MTAEDIFNMFFNDAPPPGHMRRAYRTHYHHEEHEPHNGNRVPHLLQLVPLLLMLLLTLLSYGSQNESVFRCVIRGPRALATRPLPCTRPLRARH